MSYNLTPEKVPPTLLIIIFIALNAFSFYIVKNFFNSEKHVDLMQTIVVFWTGVILIWYTWETWGLRKESQKNNELQLRPFVVAEFHIKTPMDPVDVILRNVGNGTAINVNINNIEFSYEHELFGGKNGNSSINFKGPLPVLSKEQKTSVDYECIVNGQINQGFFLALMRCDLPPVIINFSDVEMKSYIVEEKISSGKIEILESRMAL
jgi:hypothetical protein